jgi:hypothetical protein
MSANNMRQRLNIMLAALFSASWFDLAALVFGVGAVIALYMSGLEAKQNIAKLNAEAEASRAQIAEANAKTAEAEVALAQLRQHVVHRMPDAQVMLPFLKQSKASVEIRYPKEDLDAATLARSLEGVLHAADWDVSLTPISVAELADENLSPSWWYLEARSIPEYGMGSAEYLATDGRVRNINGGIHRFGIDTPVDKSPFSLLVVALFRGVGRPASSSASPDPTLPEGHLRLFILPQSWWVSQ